MAVAGRFESGQTEIKDLRLDPHSGYRAVHVCLRLPVRVEVQIRTHVQGAWANVYEAAADMFGREIRYGQNPKDPAASEVVDALKSLSTEAIAGMEEERNLKARELLRLQEDVDGESPIFGQQVRDRLESEWNRRREDELRFRDRLMQIHDQFRAMQRRG
ncbi:hypothetical protein [uncultured Microbacterium sp.]|uniref:hypothetical protein n=1 Tax=uncultured Microbacterium sp. TaxID=191216 RepID=UPI002632ECE4|nr:hypothetical protein [uncultured Microbacterium sp.]